MKRIMLLGLLLTAIAGISFNQLNAKDFDEMAMYMVNGGAPAALMPKYWWQSKENIKASVEQMEKSGVNVLLPCVYSHGSYFFKTEHSFYKKGVMPDVLGYDPLELLIIEAKKKNMKVVPFFPFLAGAGDEKSLKNASDKEIPHMDWFNIDMYGNNKHGKSFSYDPANPELRKHLVSLVEDLLKYDIDGLQLDYIRYVGTQWGYTPKARELFMKEHGVDPMVLSNTPDKIDTVILYCLKPLAYQEKPWYLSRLITLMNKINISYKIVDETAEGIPDIPPKSILLLPSCYSLSKKEVSQLSALLENGSDIIFIDGPTKAMTENETDMGPILGLKNKHKFFPAAELTLSPLANHPATKGFDTFKLSSSGNSFLRSAIGTAQEIASFDNDYPAVLLNKYRNGNVFLFNYDMLMSKSDDCGDKLLKNAINWLSEEKKLHVYTYLPNDILIKYAWIPTVTRTFLNAARIAPELIVNLDELKTLLKLDKNKIQKTSLIYTSYFDPGPEAINLLCEYVKKGGNLIIFLDQDVNIKDMATGSAALSKYPEFFKLLPVGKAAEFKGNKNNYNHNYSSLSFKNTNDSSMLLKNIPPQNADFYGAPFEESDKAPVVIRFSDSMPALFHCKSGDGNIWTFNYGMQSTGETPALLLNNVIMNIAASQGVNYLSDKISQLLEKWDSWRCEQVTTLVKMVKETMNKNKPGIPLSAAVVDSYYPEKVVFQNWKNWLNNGYVDRVYPMDYFSDDSNLKRMLAWQIKDIKDECKVKICPIIALYKKDTVSNQIVPVTSEEIARQIEILKKDGYKNIGFFADSYITDDNSRTLRKSAE